jgi:hypothetical protein
MRDERKFLRQEAITNGSNTDAQPYLLYGEMRHGEHLSKSRELHLPGGTAKGAVTQQASPGEPPTTPGLVRAVGAQWPLSMAQWR